MIHQQRNNRRTGVKTFEQSVGDFWEKVDSTNLHDPLKCWNWLGKTRVRNYGRCYFQGKALLAHRASFVVHHGAIPEGLEVCHRCDNPACVNPNHLFLGTHFDNMRDAKNKKRFSNNWKGAKHLHSKLKERDVLEMRRAYRMGVPAKELAVNFNIATCTVYGIVNRKSWSHLP